MRPLRQDVHDVGLDVVEQALVVGDHDERAVGRAQRVDAVGDDAQRVDVEAAIGLVENAEARLQHRHLEDLVALLLAAGKADIERALQHVLIDLQRLAAARTTRRNARRRARPRRVAALGVERGAQESHVVHAGNLDRVLEGEEQPLARPLVGRHREQIAPSSSDLALGHLVARRPASTAASVDLARAVRPHDRVHLAAPSTRSEVEAVEDRLPSIDDGADC